MIIRKKSLSAFALLFTIIGFSECTKETATSEALCFKTQVQPIIVSNCTQSQCHNATDKAKGLDYSTYEGIMESVKAGNYRSSELYQVLVIPFGEEAMPKEPYNRLTTAQIKTIATWIEEGAKNDISCGTSTVCDTSVISYSSDIKPILDNYCNGCHTGDNPSADLDYTLHAGVKATADNGSLMKSLFGIDGYSLMPYNADPLSDCDISKIQKWVNDGAPNN